MKIFQIGERESEAVSNLQDKVDLGVVQELRGIVRCRGMRRFLSHELIARGLFNKGFTSGTGVFDGWAEQLTNGSDGKLVPRH